MINVTKSYLPDFDEYTKTLKRAWDKAWLTNNGVLVNELEENLKNYLGVEHLHFTTNGTIVLQIALKGLEISKEVITTPFSYVATTNAILWENCIPIFTDIDKDTYCIDAAKIEAAITENTQAIMATHVYGQPCDVEKIEQIASKYDLKVIYDGAHAFGSNYKGKPLLSFGDISTCSFHATKIFHTVEGGCIISNNEVLSKKLELYRQFGHIGDDYYSIGINGKNSEFHAAMGLCILPKIDSIIEERKRICATYDKLLNDTQLLKLKPIKELDYNFAYYPIVFKSESQVLSAKQALEEQQIFSRRYFYPSLNTLPFVNGASCPVSEDIASRVLCLPLFVGLEKDAIQTISRIINATL